MRKAVNDIIDIFTSENMENMSLVIYIYIFKKYKMVLHVFYCDINMQDVVRIEKNLTKT